MSKTIVKRSQVLSMNGNRTVIEMSACRSRDNKSMGFFFKKKKKINSYNTVQMERQKKHCKVCSIHPQKHFTKQQKTSSH